MTSMIKEPLEPPPTWEEINLGARVLFANKFDLDLHIAQRMSYEDFERLFYHLFLLVDSQEAKRKFSKLVYPAMDQEARNKFIDLAVRFINDKQLCSQRVATSQLRMYGGEAFRRLVGTLMSTAAAREIANLASRSQLTEQQADSSPNLESAVDHIESLKDEIANQESLLKGHCDKLRNWRAKRAEYEQQAEECWYSLTRDLKGFSNPRSQEQALHMVTCLLSRLEATSSENKALVEKLKVQKLPAFGGDEIETKSPVESNERRLSQFIREARAQIGSNHALKDANRNNLAKEMREKLIHVDSYMDKMLERLPEEAEKADQVLLKNPQILESFRDLESTIPLISLPSLITQPGAEEVPPSVDALAKILTGFPEDGCDDREVLEIYEQLVNKQALKD